MDILIKVVQFLLSLSILVFFHELGHFTFAKLFKTKVEKFYMFFDPWFSLFKFKKGETEYGIGWLPLGGYVKIAGMIDESMDKEQMKKDPQPWEFRSKPAWQRLLIMIGGVLVNVILAFVIYAGVMYTYGETYLPTKNIKNGVVSGELFSKLGVENGDKVVSLDKKEIIKFTDVIPTILLENPTSMQVERNGEIIDIKLPSDIAAQLLELSSENGSLTNLLAPRIKVEGVEIASFADKSIGYDAGMREGDRIIAINNNSFSFYDEFTNLVEQNKNKIIQAQVLRSIDTLTFDVQLDDDAKLGFFATFPDQKLEYSTQKYSFFASIPAGIDKGLGQLGAYVKQLKLLFSNGGQAAKSVGGFASIANIFPGEWNWESFWNLTAFISIMLAVMNILPIPALDGGHVLFLVYEVITRRKPSDKFMEYAQTVGMVLLLGLFLLANINDVLKFLF